jgi:hypothetical protein
MENKLHFLFYFEKINEDHKKILRLKSHGKKVQKWNYFGVKT